MPKEAPPSARPGPGPSGYLLDNRWHIHPDINRIFNGETEHQVPDKFMQVLVVLLENSGVVSRQELFDAVWPDTLVVDESLTRAISSLRKLFGDDPKNPHVIETIPKKGYRLLVPVEPLETVVDHTPIEDLNPTLPTPSAPPVAERRWPILLAAIIAVISVAGWWLVLHRESKPRHEAVRSQITALPGIEEYPALSPTGDRVAYVWGGDDVEPDGVFVQVIGAGPAMRLTHVDGHYAFPTWSHDSRFIAFARVAGPSRGIFRVPATGGAEIELVASSGDEVLTAPTFSPDGRWLVFAARQAPGLGWQLRRTDLETGTTDTLAPSAEIPFGGYRPRFSPDGRRLAFLRLDTDRRTIAITTIDGAAPTLPDLGDRTVLDYDWTSDGNNLVVNGAGEIAIVATDGAPVRTIKETRSSGALSVARNRQLLAYSLGRREKNIWRWSPASGPAGGGSQRIVHSTAWDAFPALSPDGRHIAFLSDRTGVPNLWIAAGDGSRASMAAEIKGVLWAPPIWSPDGRQIALTVEVDRTTTTSLVDVPGGKTTVLPAPECGEVVTGWSREGSAVYVTRDADDGSAIWRRPLDAKVGHAVKVIRDGGYRAVEAPDGSALYFTRSRRAAEIWRCDLSGSHPVRVFALDAGEILTWGLTADGLFIGYRDEIGDKTYTILFHDFSTGDTTELLDVPGRLGFHLDIDPSDGHSIVFDQTEAVDSDIFAIEGF